MKFFYDTPPIFVFLFDLHLIGRKMHHQVGILTFDLNKMEKNEFDKNYLGTFQFGVFVQLDVACS